jgi:hypothetical protein
VGNKTHAAGVVFVPGVIQTRCLGVAGLVHNFTSGLAGLVERISTSALTVKANAVAPGGSPTLP